METPDLLAQERADGQVEETQQSLLAAGFLLAGTFTPGQRGRVCEGAAGRLLEAAAAAGMSPAEVLVSRTAPPANDEDADALLRSLGI